MAKELAPIDITNIPDLLRVAEDVHATKRPRVLRRNDEDIAVVMPIAGAPGSRRSPRSAVADALAAGFQAVPALKELLSVEQMTEIAAEEHVRMIVGEGR
jgi:hypothetical protein